MNWIQKTICLCTSLLFACHMHALLLYDTAHMHTTLEYQHCYDLRAVTISFHTSGGAASIRERHLIKRILYMYMYRNFLSMSVQASWLHQAMCECTVSYTALFGNVQESRVLADDTVSLLGPLVTQYSEAPYRFRSTPRKLTIFIVSCM